MSAVETERPMRLLDAARAVMGEDTPSAAWLRRQASEGKLALWRIAGKDYTTPTAIREMVQLCRAKQKELGSGYVQPQTSAKPHGLSSTEESRFALDALRQTAKRLKESSRTTSRPATKLDASAVVTRFPSP